MVEHVDQRDEVEILSGIGRAFVELVSNPRSRNFHGDRARNRIWFDPMQLLETVARGGLQKKSHVATDVEHSVPLLEMRYDQLVISRHGSANIILLTGQDIRFRRMLVKRRYPGFLHDRTGVGESAGRTFIDFIMRGIG